MKVLMEKAGASFLRAIGVAALAFLPGILNAPNYDLKTSLAVGASFAVLAAGLRAIQVFIPKITTGNAIADAFLRMFLGTFVASVIGFLSAPTHSAAVAALLGLLLGALAAGARGVQAFLTHGEKPSPGSGIAVPAAPAPAAAPAAPA
jgi:hypothetical protein